MQKLYLKQELAYDGTQLCSHFAYRNFGILGDVIFAFQGPCRVGLGEMVDLEDVRDGLFIYSPRMLSFIVEHFKADLEEAVLRQRLLVALAAELLRSLSPQAKEGLVRRGDDLFLDGRKLSVSIATVSPVSSLIHFGINVLTEGTPVPTAGLAELGVEPADFAERLMDAYVEECAGIEKARCKVRWVT
ncbi:MAG: DUF366 family protein [Thermacetogeniaceae bacterium]